jgi:hypothetical protein
MSKILANPSRPVEVLHDGAWVTGLAGGVPARFRQGWRG